MIWQVWVDIAISLAIPVTTIYLYYTHRIQKKHLGIMIWGFIIGSTWEFSFYFMGDSLHIMKTEWPMPIITLHVCHTFWDAGLFIVGYWLCLLFIGSPDCCTKFRWIELIIMWVWGVGQAFVVELLGNGVIWEYRVLAWNPEWITIGSQSYTILIMVIWMIAPIVYYLGFIRINRDKGRSFAS
jgi:hypothetical protein